MSRPFFPTRARGWALLVLLLLVLYAIFSPVYAYSGPGTGGVAVSIARQRRESGAWPKAYADRAGRFDYSLLRAEGRSAIYRVRAGRDREEWWVFDRGRAVKID